MKERLLSWLEADDQRRVWVSGTVGGLWGALVFVMVVLLPSVRRALGDVFGASYPVVVAILATGFGIALGLTFTRLDAEIDL